VTTATRIAAEPSIPTIAESGVPGYDVSNWHGLIGPKGLPRAVVERINGEVNKIVRSKEMEERLRSDGVSPTGGTADALQEQVRREIVMWRDAVKVADIKIQ
jgi:tripartite-type tricarboxylate transporter receptor subunit TctC